MANFKAIAEYASTQEHTSQAFTKTGRKMEMEKWCIRVEIFLRASGRTVNLLDRPRILPTLDLLINKLI